MTVLYVVPNVYIRNFRRSLSREGDFSLVMTMPGLVAQILKEGLVSYKEDGILEEVAIWQSVQDHAASLDFFAPIAHFSGFMQELKRLFRQIDLGEEIFQAMPETGQAELRSLHTRYQQILNERGILNAPGQIRRSIELAKEVRVLPEVNVIKLLGLGELSPVEKALIDIMAEGRSLEIVRFQVENPVIEVRKAKDPIAEVEMIGEALREQIKGGIPLEKLGVAFPNPAQYLPILLPVFDKLKIPWRTPEGSLRNTPLGKTFLTLLAGELEGWQKHHLELLTAPGWGFPFGLSTEEHRLLRLAPPLKGLPAFRDYLGKEPGWENVLQILTNVGHECVTRPLKEFGAWMERLLEKLQPEAWVTTEDNLENWAELVKAWDGMQTIAQSLGQYDWAASPEQFLQLLQSLFDNYQIQGRRVFAERVQVISVEQLGAYTYDQLYVGGLVEGQFPPRKNAHWLTKTRTISDREELYQRLTGVAPLVYLHYPEVDREGKLNLPATILPKIEEETEALLSEQTHYPSLFFGKGNLSDPELLSLMQERIVNEGLSVSQLNSYANCPYQFFCSHVLKLMPDEERSLELDARDHGNVVHQVLQTFWEEHLEGPLPSIEKGQAKIEGLLRKEYGALGTMPSLGLIRTMRDFIRHDLTSAQGGFRPRYLEKWFQGLVIKTPVGPVGVRGRIDRIDLHPDGAYVLYDYKTGSAPQINAMVDGKDVQIAAYLLAAQSILPQGKNVGAAYYVIGDGSRKGIFHEDYHKMLGVRGGKNVLPEQGFTEQNKKFAEILQGLVGRILEGKFPVEPASSRICSYCAFQGICRKEVGS